VEVFDPASTRGRLCYTSHPKILPHSADSNKFTAHSVENGQVKNTDCIYLKFDNSVMTSEMHVRRKHGKIVAAELWEGERGHATYLWP
jgi:hypothetical protein